MPFSFFHFRNKKFFSRQEEKTRSVIDFRNKVSTKSEELMANRRMKLFLLVLSIATIYGKGNICFMNSE